MKRFPPGAVLAAGALVWRVRDGQLQVLAVHRPRYRDWSWPKGKVDRGETLPACAVREVAEETGKQVILGQPLPTLRYPLDGGKVKVVWYWAARVAPEESRAVKARPKVKAAPKNEIDKTKWLTVAQARDRITFADDLIPLERLVRLYEEGRLDTVAVTIARHARARRRHGWFDSDDARPLSRTGMARALQLVGVFAAFGAARVHTSPAERCEATVRPYAAAGKIKIKEHPQLREAAHAANPLGTAGVVSAILAKGMNAVVCVHRPTLPTVITMIQSAMRDFTTGSVPTKNPYLPAGGVLVAHVVDTESGPRVSAVETHLLASAPGGITPEALAIQA